MVVFIAPTTGSLDRLFFIVRSRSHPDPAGTVSYNAEHIIGNGSFGVVFQAVVVETGEVVAIKKVLQDKRFKNRELQIMRMLVKKEHPNIVRLKHCFYSNGDKVCIVWGGLTSEIGWGGWIWLFL